MKLLCKWALGCRVLLQKFEPCYEGICIINVYIQKGNDSEYNENLGKLKENIMTVSERYSKDVLLVLGDFYHRLDPRRIDCWNKEMLISL